MIFSEFANSQFESFKNSLDDTITQMNNDMGYIFNDCKDQRPLPFDFYLPDYNLIVEIMGEQHESPVDIFGGEEKFEITVMHDKLKRDYLNNHNIDILDIWYYEFNRMENLILNKLASQQLKTITT